MGIAKVQHYVPQFLLREFGNGKKNHLHVFDKLTGRASALTNRRRADGLYGLASRKIHSLSTYGGPPLSSKALGDKKHHARLEAIRD